MNHPYKRLLGLMLLLAVIVPLGACRHDDGFTTGNQFISPISPADISYNALASNYNQTVGPLSTLWARTDIDIAWAEIDDAGDRRVRGERGDGKLIMRRPSDIALTVEKLGKIYLWAGSNREQYWLFDLVDGDNKTAYLGAFDKLSQPGRRAYPLPVYPQMVPDLLGLVPLPIIDEAQQPTVELYDGHYLVELRGEGMRLLIDRTTYRPVRVDLLDRSGFSVLTAKLTGSFPVEVDGLSKSQWPTICKEAEIFVAGYESRLTISMNTATTSTDKVRDPMFNFEMLSKALKPDQVESLDR